MKKIATIGLGLMITLGLSVSALAGRKLTREVFISTTDNRATGTVGSARNSADNNQHIGCWINGGVAPTPTRAYCWARDAAGTYSRLCFSEEPGIIAAAQSITEISFIQFTWDTAGVCQSLSVQNLSWNDPSEL